MASEIMVCIGILLSFHVISQYTVPQYVCSGLIVFVSAEVLEGEKLFNSKLLLMSIMTTIEPNQAEHHDVQTFFVQIYI